MGRRRGGSRGRSSSRRSRGKTGGQGSGGSGKGKGTGGSRGRSSGTRGGQGKGGSGTGKGTGGSRGRSNNTRGGQSKANRNQNKKARRTVNSVKKAASRITQSLKGLPAAAATHIANSKYNKQLKKANWTKRDMSKLSKQDQRRYQRLSEKTGRDYSIRKPTFRLNLNADTIAKFGGFADKGWYKGLTNRFPGIKKLKINKQFYGNPMKKGWHSSQRTGRGHGVPDSQRVRPGVEPPTMGHFGLGIPGSWQGGGFLPTIGRLPPPDKNIRRTLPVGPPPPDTHGDPVGPSPDWLGDFYRQYNIGGQGGKLDQEARDYWTNEAKTKGRDSVMNIIRGTAKAQGTWGGRKKPVRRGGGIGIDRGIPRKLAPRGGPSRGSTPKKPTKRTTSQAAIDRFESRRGGSPTRRGLPRPVRRRGRGRGISVGRPKSKGRRVGPGGGIAGLAAHMAGLGLR